MEVKDDSIVISIDHKNAYKKEALETMRGVQALLQYALTRNDWIGVQAMLAGNMLTLMAVDREKSEWVMKDKTSSKVEEWRQRSNAIMNDETMGTEDRARALKLVYDEMQEWKRHNKWDNQQGGEDE